MYCCSSASLSILWNAVKLDPFVPEKGISQGGPLFPYLFVLYMEVLSKHISQEMEVR